MLRLAGLAERLKSAEVAVTVTTTMWLNVPLVPVTVTVPPVAPDVAVTVSVAVPEVCPDAIVMVPVLRVAVNPVGSVAGNWRLTVPVNPSNAVTFMVEGTPWPPIGTFMLLGDAETEKSETVTVKVVECCNKLAESVPVTVTVSVVPATVSAGTVIETTAVPEPVTGFGLVVAEAQFWVSDTVSATEPLYPSIDETVTCAWPVAGIVWLAGIVTEGADSEKSGVAGAAKFVVSGLPMPVTKSYPAPALFEPAVPVVMSLKSALYTDGELYAA